MKAKEFTGTDVKSRFLEALNQVPTEDYQVLKKGVKEAMRDGSVGSVYNLTMLTSSNPADVRTAFELMEAWA